MTTILDSLISIQETLSKAPNGRAKKGWPMSGFAFYISEMVWSLSIHFALGAA